MLYAVIMAGGVGTRFWPASRQALPKQFLTVGEGRTLLQQTVDRLDGLVDNEGVFVVTHDDYVEMTRAQLPEVPPGNVLGEPTARNTAPCIAFAAATIAARDPDATLVVLPADHLVRHEKAFRQVLRAAARQAQVPGALVTIGITPTHPETGYGYIQFDGTLDALDDDGIEAYPVRTFAEKPDLATAERFLDSGDFLWNSGMFVWRADSILDAFERYLPDVHEAFLPVRAGDSHAATVEKAYARSPKISIDYGVMERAAHVFVVPGQFGWSDVGDWRAVFDLENTDAQGNALHGTVITESSSRCYVRGHDKLVALVGIHDAIVVETEDAILVCHRDSAQRVKNLVEFMSLNGYERYL